MTATQNTVAVSPSKKPIVKEIWHRSTVTHVVCLGHKRQVILWGTNDHVVVPFGEKEKLPVKAKPFYGKVKNLAKGLILALVDARDYPLVRG